eukprot:g3652.t1
MTCLNTHAVGSSSAALPTATLRLSKHYTHRGPTSRFLESGGNGSSIPANGAVWPTAIYWTTVQVGTPAQDFPVAIDSGSGDLDIGGKGCVGCVTGPPNNAYDHTASSTAKAAFPFVFSNSYQTCDLKQPTAVCTISGRLYKDQASLAGLGPVEVTLGSISKQTTNFDQFKEIDGVMGFTMGSSKNVFTQLVANKKCDNVWAMCMTEGSKSNGTITIGGVDERLSVGGNVSYVPDTGLGFHSVKVESLRLGGSKTSGTSGGSQQAASGASVPVSASAILDTGTNVLLLGSSVKSALNKAMCADSSLASCADLWSNKCVSLTDAQVKAYPPLTLVLNGGSLELDMTPQDYLLKGSPLAASADQYCLGIRDGGSAGGSGFIIGDTTMRNYYLVFDLAQKRIGWGKVNKDQCGSV